MSAMRLFPSLTALLFLALTFPGPLLGADAPWDFARPLQPEPPRRSAVHTHSPDPHPLKLGMGYLLSFHQNVLSEVDGPKCHYYPTCSQYSREAVQMYGPAWGVVMTANRFQREYPGFLHSGRYTLVHVGQWRAYNPPEYEWIGGDRWQLPPGMR